MSFLEANNTIKDGDLILAWMNRSNIRPIFIKSGEVFHSQYGSFPHDKIIGKPFGSQIPGSTGRGFIHVIAPTPELWSLSLRHRTQIVYTPDASYIVQRLGIRPGSRVIEAGTGSGSFTHALARTINKKGQLFTFEFHKPRYEEALIEITQHKLHQNTVITHRDVCQDGFLKPNIDNAMDPESVRKTLKPITKKNEKGEEEVILSLQASSVFLDLPSPWLAIPHLADVMDTAQQTSICCFSPCMEQVTRTVETLKREGWRKIEMVEVSSKRWEGHKEMIRGVDDAVERLRDVKRRRIIGLRRRNNRIQKELENKKKGVQKQEEQDEDIVLEDVTVEEEDLSAGQEQRETTDNNTSNKSSSKIRGYNPWGKGMRIKEGDERFEWRDVSRVEYELKSHTSYLTFAVHPPALPEGLVNEEQVVISSIPPPSTTTAEEKPAVANVEA